MPQLGKAPFGAVILGHERYGLVQHTLDLAAKFARYGYVCIAPDMASHWDGDKAALNRGDVRFPLSEERIQYYYSQSLDFLVGGAASKRQTDSSDGCMQEWRIPFIAQ